VQRHVTPQQALVETLIAALVLLLTGKALGIAIALAAFLGAMAIAGTVMLGMDTLRRCTGRRK
jgi:hypothetical protein